MSNFFYQHVLFLEQELLKNLSSGPFPDVSQMILEQHLNVRLFSGLPELLSCLPQTKEVPQYYPPTGFGKFNLTLTSNPHFMMIVMFMDQQSTEIHNHPFIGAFAPLVGEPFEARLRFERKTEITPWIDSGELKLESIRALSTGEARKVEPDSIHMLSRSTSGQCSLLVAQLIPERKNNSFFLHPGLKVTNRRDTSYLARMITAFNLTTDEALALSFIQSLEMDQLIQLYLSIGEQLAATEVSDELRMEVRSLCEKILKTQPVIWENLSRHAEFLHQMETKLKLLK